MVFYCFMFSEGFHFKVLQTLMKTAMVFQRVGGDRSKQVILLVSLTGESSANMFFPMFFPSLVPLTGEKRIYFWTRAVILVCQQNSNIIWDKYDWAMAIIRDFV